MSILLSTLFIFLVIIVLIYLISLAPPLLIQIPYNHILLSNNLIKGY